MTRYEEMMRTNGAERALNRYQTDRKILDADSVTFQPIDDMDMGERYLVSYHLPTIVPISEILWVRFVDGFGKKYMWALVSDGYSQLLLVKEPNNIDTIVKMLLERNKKFIYGDNEPLKELFENDYDMFLKLIASHPNEEAANIEVDDSLLLAPEEEVPETPADSDECTEKPETTYNPPKEQELDSVTVPESLPFAEEMELLIHLAKTYPDEVYLTLYEPVSAETIAEFESRNNIKLTEELKSLFLFTNGFSTSAGNLDINSLELIESYISEKWEWEDTKNYLYIGDMIGDGEIILLDLDSGNIITNDHGEETDYGDLTWLLADTICTFLDGEVEDEQLDAYISEVEGMDE